MRTVFHISTHILRNSTAGHASLSLRPCNAATSLRCSFGFSTAPARPFKRIAVSGLPEIVFERSEWPLSSLQHYFSEHILAFIGYGNQGRAQSLNARDNGVDCIIGVQENGEGWKQAVSDGWVAGKTLFSVKKAVEHGTVILNLLSDAAQVQQWPVIAPLLTGGKTLCFSHGFSVVFRDQTGITLPEGIDVILVAPQSPGLCLRESFQDGHGVNSSVAVWQDVSGSAKEMAVLLGFTIGSGSIYETTFEKQTFADLVGKCGVLGGAIQGLYSAQYKVLRANGHSPSEAFNETVEEATQSLLPLIGKFGMDYMMAACSTTARRGGLDWAPVFEQANHQIFEKLYESVKNGTEARRAIEFNSRSNQGDDFTKELEELSNQEMWRAGKVVRSLRPENI